MTESENTHLSFDNLLRSVAELHEKIDRLTVMLEQILSNVRADSFFNISTPYSPISSIAVSREYLIRFSFVKCQDVNC